jgi:hypothetical protein
MNRIRCAKCSNLFKPRRIGPKGTLCKVCHRQLIREQTRLRVARLRERNKLAEGPSYRGPK